jgi:cytoskeleton protein RodZ
MATEEGSAEIGARLRAAREKKGLTILQSAEKLHMDARLLEALEGGDFVSLGAPVYVRGHLRRYAELVGESAADLQTLYSGALAAASTPDLTRIPRAERNAESSQLLLPALIGVVALALAGVIWWLVSLPRTKAHAVATVSQPVSTEAAASGAIAPPVPAAPEPDAPSEQTRAPPGVAAAAAVPAPAAAPSGQVHLELRAAEDSWVKIWDGSDKPLLDTTMQSGTARALEGAPPLRVQIGNAHGVGLAINGQVVNLDGMARKRGDARLWVDKAGQVSMNAPPPPGE